MIVLDTSAWIEWLIDSEIGGRLGVETADKEDIFVPTIVQYELSKWLKREISEIAAEDAISFTLECSVVELNTKRALQAADLGRQHKLSTADSIVYACALEMEADLLTCDRHFKGLENVVLFEKKGTLQ